MSVAHVSAVVALDAAVVTRLRTLLAHVAFVVAIAADHDTLIGAVGLAVAILIAVKALAASAAFTGLGGLGAVDLVMTERGLAMVSKRRA